MTLSPSEVDKGLELFTLKPGVKVRMEVLKDLVPDMTTALFFGKLYDLDYKQLSDLLRKLFKSTVIQALLNEGDTHSSELQDYIITTVPDAELMSAGIVPASFTDPVTHEFLPELWESLEVEIASSIKQLVDSLDGVLSMVQGKYGKMLFSTLAQLNKQRQGILGTYKAQIVHPMVPNNLVIFDVSGSVSRSTAEKIIDEVVALAYKANASLAIVSDNTFFWDAGTFNSDLVMAKAEFSGTQYETLTSVLDRDWATVITIADFDSAHTAKDYLSQHATGHVQQVLDISLVDQPTFLAQCVGQLADKVTSLLVGHSQYVIESRYDQLYGPNRQYR